MKREDNFIPSAIKLKLKELFKATISDYYNLVIKREKKISSLGIFTDSDISTFIIACNTQYASAKSDDDKWWMPEWIYDSSSGESSSSLDDRFSQLDKTTKALIEKSNWDFDDDKNTFSKYKNEMFECMCDSLMELKEENLFNEVSKDFFLLVQESDNGIYEDRQKCLKKIMTEEQLGKYLKFSG